MSPYKEFPDDEPESITSKRTLQRLRKEMARERAGKPEPSELAQQMALALWSHRLVNGMTQEQLGEALGVKQPQVARLESGLVEPNVATLIRISERLDIDFNVEVKSGRMTASATPRRGSRQA